MGIIYKITNIKNGLENNNSFTYKNYFITTHFEGVETIESIG